ncbi:Trypanosomal VSG domain containing protein [Trypanosoma brucei equiperdum]|uniref:Trypanosomal VSG domain containing protein n=1 Tax=Trypanosoma brucei equiperdum TaxID=630700 RepID=A0A3L6L5V0_9TRYP|nr:Trypanosomal VSG domain containing protein [Trypanosoma brucei equiperdum]RHW72030.1 Trypanosomal VSG domain containing protein [Trypanosoma brucei equiperdum]RHW72054.1 Trypanosomal VSG domain containing protein [Trypanosoma brucei equiperdum]RHW72244.1 Trypanosomal VSG domain containing protein [Trypanosoma brucei equiperdum]
MNDIKTALCSNPLEPKESADGCKALSAGNQKSTTYGNGSDGKSGKLIGHDFLCLCTTVTNSECVHGEAGAPGVITSDTFVSATLDGLLAKCPTATEEVGSVTLAEAVITNFQSRLGESKNPYTAGDVYLGKNKETDCTATNSTCINYKHYFANHKEGTEDIPWVKKIRSVVAHVKTMMAENSRRRQAEHIIGRIKDTIKRSFAENFQQRPQW